MANAEPLWTVSNVAEFLQCSPSWVYKAAESGRLPTIRVGSMIRFDPAAIRRLTQGQGSGVKP
ncbi:MAG: helix-turn-helix domain-containing protein [Myxococcaceae bacterium]